MFSWVFNGFCIEKDQGKADTYIPIMSPHQAVMQDSNVRDHLRGWRRIFKDASIALPYFV